MFKFTSKMNEAKNKLMSIESQKHKSKDLLEHFLRIEINQLKNHNHA